MSKARGAKLNSWEHLIIDVALEHYQNNMDRNPDYTQLARDQFRALRKMIEKAEMIILKPKAEEKRQAAFDAANAKHPLPISGEG